MSLAADLSEAPVLAEATRIDAAARGGEAAQGA
jgi:hypothetical protein